MEELTKEQLEEMERVETGFYTPGVDVVIHPDDDLEDVYVS